MAVTRLRPDAMPQAKVPKLCITPLGAPVVPEVYMMVAMSSAARSGCLVGRRLRDDVVPGRTVRLHIGWRQRVTDAGQGGRHARLHAFPTVELADEQQLGARVLKDLADGAGSQRGVQRYRDRAGQPDGEVAHHPVRVFLDSSATRSPGNTPCSRR